MSLKRISDTYILSVDYETDIKEAVKRGDYVLVDELILQSHFYDNRARKAVVEISFFYFDCYVFSRDVIKEINKRNYRPACFRELLAFGEKFPHVQQEPIAALGSICQNTNGSYAACINCCKSFEDVHLYDPYSQQTAVTSFFNRFLNFIPFKILWPYYWGFAGVRSLVEFSSKSMAICEI